MPFQPALWATHPNDKFLYDHTLISSHFERCAGHGISR